MKNRKILGWRSAVFCLAVLGFSYFASPFFVRAEVDTFRGVKNVWVSASQWPNAKTQETFAKDAVHFYGAENGTDEEKAKAIYYYAQRVMGHGGDYFQGPYGSEKPVWDSWMIFHDYPKALCEWWGWFLIDLWKAYNNNWSFDPATGVARKVGVNAKLDNPNYGTHVESALRYVDADGVSRWHLFDGERAFFLYTNSSSTKRIATPDEIKAGFPNELKIHSNQPDPFFIGATIHGDPESDSAFHTFLGDTYPWSYSSSQRKTKFSTDFDLRVGESLKRQWYDDGKWVINAAQKTKGIDVMTDSSSRYKYNDGSVKDPFNFGAIWPYMKNYSGLGLRKPFGNAHSIYTPELTNGKYKEGAKSTSGLASQTGDVKLGPATIGVEGEVIYQIRSIYPFAESFITGNYYLKSPGRVAIDFSLDRGGTWNNVMNATSTGPNMVPINIDIGKTRWSAGLPSPYNMPDRYHIEGGNPQYNDYTYPNEYNKVIFTGYQYLVRIRMVANTNTQDVGLVNLAFKNTHQTNIGMLPALLPGNNTIKLEGNEMSSGTVLKIEYAWQENGIPKQRTEYTTALPYSFDILVEESNPLNVKSLYYTISVENQGGSSDTEAPSAPQNVVATTNSINQINISWSAATDNIGVTGYRLDVATDPDFSQILNDYNNKNVDNTLQAVVTGLMSSTTYYVRLRAYDVAGNTSTNSQTASVKTLAGNFVKKYDFGTAASPVKPEYTRVAKTLYTDSLGHGWLSTANLTATDRGTAVADLLNRDLIQNSASGTIGKFSVKVPIAGRYAVKLYFGDTYKHDNMQIKAEGSVALSSVTTNAKEWKNQTIVVQVNDGRLDLEISDTGGVSVIWAINGLEVSN